jgi:nicotinamidase-related amidase
MAGAHPALLVVDAQNDFLTHPSLTPDAASLTKNLQELLEGFRRRSWPVFHVRTEVAADGHDAMPHWRKRSGLSCITGTKGAEAPSALQPAHGEPVLIKKFFSAFGNPDLAATLKRKNIGRVVIAGVHTHACVRETAVGAYERGFEVFIPTDAIASYDAHHAAATLEWLQGRASQNLSSADIFSLLER